MKTLVVSDLDGTLFNADTQLSDFTVKAVNMLIENGMNFSYATARSLNSAHLLTSRLKLNMPVITYNGACIKNPADGSILEIQGLDSQQVEFLRSAFEEFGIYPLVYTFLNGEEKVLWLRGSESEGMKYYLDSRRDDERMLPVDSFDDLFCGEMFYFTCIEDSQEQLQPLFEALNMNDTLHNVLQQELYRTEYWLEIMDVRATKANALGHLKRITDCERVIAFGDSINDMPLFEAADECYAVENAVGALKVVSDDVIESNDEDGVARWLIENRNRLI